MDFEEFEQYEPKTPFEKAAYEAVKKAWEELAYLKEVTDRTSGKPEQQTDITTNGESLNKVEVSKEQIDKLIDKL